MMAVIPSKEWLRLLTSHLVRIWEEGSHPRDVQQEIPLLEPTMLAPEPWLAPGSRTVSSETLLLSLSYVHYFVMTLWMMKTFNDSSVD